MLPLSSAEGREQASWAQAVLCVAPSKATRTQHGFRARATQRTLCCSSLALNQPQESPATRHRVCARARARVRVRVRVRGLASRTATGSAQTRDLKTIGRHVISDESRGWWVEGSPSCDRDERDGGRDHSPMSSFKKDDESGLSGVNSFYQDKSVRSSSLSFAVVCPCRAPPVRHARHGHGVARAQDLERKG